MFLTPFTPQPYINFKSIKSLPANRDNSISHLGRHLLIDMELRYVNVKDIVVWGCRIYNLEQNKPVWIYMWCHWFQVGDNIGSWVCFWKQTRGRCRSLVLVVPISRRTLALNSVRPNIPSPLTLIIPKSFTMSFTSVSKKMKPNDIDPLDLARQLNLFRSVRWNVDNELENKKATQWIILCSMSSRRVTGLQIGWPGSVLSKEISWKRVAAVGCIDRTSTHLILPTSYLRVINRLFLVPLSFPANMYRSDYLTKSRLSLRLSPHVTHYRYPLWNGRFSRMSRTDLIYRPLCQGKLSPLYTIQLPGNILPTAIGPSSWIWLTTFVFPKSISWLGSSEKIVILRSLVVWKTAPYTKWIFFDNWKYNETLHYHTNNKYTVLLRS